jgi:hypothetical protein
MTDIPHAVLSEHLEERLRGRRLVAAVFLTFRFDPGFFEEQVLPVFLNVPVSHATAIKLVQLEDALKTVSDGIAVYYDQNGLVPEAGSGRLDVRRVAVRHRTGIFHPKNVFALVEEIEPDDDGHRARALLATCLSANLTRAGWWENVEVCHTEEVAEDSFTRLAADVVALLDGLERRVGDKASDGHSSLRAIRAFLRTTEIRERRSADGWLHAHFFDGSMSVPEFLRSVAGNSLRGMNLEIISPYFGEGPTSQPLETLVEQFEPREVRVYLPRAHTGEVLCSKEIFEWIGDQLSVTWGKLPQERVRGGKSELARDRLVHAKVYRFFQPQPKREILFVGSANLTDPAHRSGGNLETGFLVELDPPRRPDWWLTSDASKPKTFKPESEDEGATTSGGTKLSIRFHWNTESAEAFWDDGAISPTLSVRAQGVEIFRVSDLPPRTWHPLSAAACQELRRVLWSTSILAVVGDGREPGSLLVQEEGMYGRPSLLLDLSPAEILRYWSLLTLAQRAAFLEAHAPDLAQLGEGAALISRYEPLTRGETFFDRFAGIFLAFGCLERAVRSALAKGGSRRDAEYRLFGEKYDSLGNLLNRVVKEAAEGKGDLVEQYVMGLCARQLERELRREHPGFWQEYSPDVKKLRERIDAALAVRERLVARDPKEMPAFLDWFEGWFLRRATPVATEAS